jgi:hypothetical protein
MECKPVEDNNRRKHRGNRAIRFDHVGIPLCLVLACIVALAGCSPQMEIENIVLIVCIWNNGVQIGA